MSTTCASGEFLLVDGRKNTTCAICKRSGPSNTTLAHVVVMTQCNLRCMVVFSFHQLAIYIYIYIPPSPQPSQPQHNYNACTQYMRHCFRKKTTTAITQCKLQYYVQPPLATPPPLQCMHSLYAPLL